MLYLIIHSLNKIVDNEISEMSHQFTDKSLNNNSFGYWRTDNIPNDQLIIFDDLMSINSKKQTPERTTPKPTAPKQGRNLYDEFDQYTLRNLNEDEDISDNSQHKLNKENTKPCNSKFNTEPKGRNRKTINKNVSNSIPQSYLLAMETLQEVIQSKDEEIQGLNRLLVQQEQTVLNGEAKINQILLRCREITEQYEKKAAEVDVLKVQMHELKQDHQCAIKQAAQAAEKVFKLENNHILRGQQPPLQQFPFEQSPFQEPYFQKSQQAKHLHRSRSKTMQKHTSRPQNQDSRMREQTIPGFPSKPSEYIPIPQTSPLLTYQRSNHKDFISYQRQIIRSEKQLITLNYRLECLARDLTNETDRIQREQLIDKIRRQRQQIESKQAKLDQYKNI